MISFLSYLTPVAAYQFLVFSPPPPFISGYSFCSDWPCCSLSASAPILAKPRLCYSDLTSTHIYDRRSVIQTLPVSSLSDCYGLYRLQHGICIHVTYGTVVSLSERPSWNVTVLGVRVTNGYQYFLFQVLSPASTPSVPMKLYFHVSFLSHLQNLDGNLIFSSNIKLEPQSSIPITKHQIPLDKPLPSWCLRQG